MPAEGEAKGNGDVELHLPPDVAYVGLARLIVTSAARQAGMGDERIEDLKIAVSEAATSAIERHQGPEPIILLFGRQPPQSFAVTIMSAGGGDAGDSDERAMGLLLLRHLADDVDYNAAPGDAVELRFALTLDGAAPNQD